MIVYKAVVMRDYKYRSVVVTGESEVTYNIGKRSYAPRGFSAQGYGMCVFQAQSDLTIWMRDYGISGYVLKCEAARIFEPPPRCVIYSLSHGRLVKSSQEWPEGTMMTKSLVPLEVL